MFRQKELPEPMCPICKHPMENHYRHACPISGCACPGREGYTGAIGLRRRFAFKLAERATTGNPNPQILRDDLLKLLEDYFGPPGSAPGER